MELRLLRNATQVLTVAGKTILIDPMLASKSSYEAFMNTGNTHRNPLVDLPLGSEELAALISSIDAVLLTHLHLDHWDPAAQEALPKDIPVLCQSGDETTIQAAGFRQVIPIEKSLDWQGIRFDRTSGQHGTGEIGQRMGRVSGFVITHGGLRLYIAGDTIWCGPVREAIDRYRPTHIVVNGGGARFVVGDPIVMNIADILQVCGYAPDAKIYVVHLEAVNHGKEGRQEIRAALDTAGLGGRCMVPDDGERYQISTAGTAGALSGKEA